MSVASADPFDALRPSTPTLLSDVVATRYRVKFPDVEGFFTTRHHTLMDRLACIPPVVNLVDSFGGVVNFSAARSATSATEVTAEQPLLSFVDRIRVEVERSMEGKIRQEIKDEFANIQAQILANKDEYVTRTEIAYPLKVFRHSSKRSIEEWCLTHMRKKTGLSKDASLSTVVDTFVRRYKSHDVDDRPFLALKEIHDDANPVIHMSLWNKQEITEMWNHLKFDMDDEERSMYKELMNFGKGESAIFARI